MHCCFPSYVMSPGRRKNSHTSQSLCSRFISSLYFPQSYEGGILQMRKWRNTEVQSRDKYCTATEYQCWDSNLSLTQIFHFVLYHSVHCLRVKMEQPRKSMCAHARDSGPARERGVANWQVLLYFTNALFPDRSSAHLLWLLL